MALPETSQLRELATASINLRRKSYTEAAKSEQLPSAWPLSLFPVNLRLKKDTLTTTFGQTSSEQEEEHGESDRESEREDECFFFFNDFGSFPSSSSNIRIIYCIEFY